MGNPNDARIDIPLNKVGTRTGARKASQERDQSQGSSHEMNEKAGFYQRHVAGRRKAARRASQKDDDGEVLTQMGRIYDRILNFSIVTRYFLYVLPVALIISLPIIIGATAAKGATLGGVRIVWIFSWLLIVWLSLWVSKLTARFMPSIFQFLCGIVSSGTRKYALVIKNLELYLSLCGWALASLATFIPVMTRNPTQLHHGATFSKYQNSTDPAKKSDAQRYKDATGIKHWELIVQRILAATLVASLILLAEKLLIQLISIGYHRTQFDAKIQGSKRKIHLLSMLYDASRNLFPAYCPEFAQEDYIINDSIELGSGAKKGHTRSGSATPLRLLQDVGRFGDKLTSAFGNIAHEVTGKQVFNPNSAHSVVVEALEKNRSAEALAKRLWMSFVLEGKEALYREDIVEVLGAEHHDEAEEAFAVLDRDGNGDISLDEMILTICDFGKERHSIANSLHDVDQAINVLDGLLCTIVAIVVIFVFVAFLNATFTTTLATAGTALLSLSFVFAATAQEVLGSCIFLFVKHPFDVLDRVDVGDERLAVKHISLLFTVFQNVNTHKLTQVPNVVLNTLWIHNVTRSEAMRELLQIYVSFDTTLEDVQTLKNEMHAFVTEKDNSRDFQPDINIAITSLASMDKMELTVEIRHKSNWSNETVRAARRSKFLCALVLALRKIPIYAPGDGGAPLGSVDQPSYTVAVSDDQAASNRTAFDKAKDAKRLFPAKAKTESDGKGGDRGVSTATEGSDPRDFAAPPPLRYRQAPNFESDVLTSLNSRHPAADTANHPHDYVEPTTPKSLARSTSGTAEQTDLDRANDLEEVRGMLRRQSTRGKRRPSVGSAPRIGAISERSDKLPRPNGGEKFEYDPYAHTSHPATPPPKRKELPSRSQNQDEREASWPQPPTPTYRPPPTISEQPRSQAPTTTYQTRQAPPIAPPVQRQNPTPPPKDTDTAFSPTNSSQPSTYPGRQRPFTPGDPAKIRAPSPVRNPFQINALRAQAQGATVPRAVRSESRSESTASSLSGGPAAGRTGRPVAGNGNGLPRAQSQERPSQGLSVRPARNDSLGGRRIE